MNAGTPTTTPTHRILVVTSEDSKCLDVTMVELDLHDAGDVVSDHTLVHNLRSTIGPAPDGTERIERVRGAGCQYAPAR